MRRFLALVVTAVLAAGAATAQNQSWGPYPASDVKAFLEKHPEFKGSFSAVAKGSVECNDAQAAKAFEANRHQASSSPVAFEAPQSDGAKHEVITPAPVQRERAEYGQADRRATRARLAAIDEELKTQPANAKALIVERERLMQGLNQRAPAAR